MKLTDIIGLLVLIGMMGMCGAEIPAAIDKEQQWRGDIAQERCHKHWIAGYCDRMTYARLYGE